MSETDTPDGPPGADEGGDGGRASETEISLEQALLAPLDAILKAQLHSARSFLNLLLQLGYPHDEKHKGQPYELRFQQRVSVDNEEHVQTITVPALALVPIAPLAVSSAEFHLEMAVRHIARHTQMRLSERLRLEAAQKRGEGPAAAPEHDFRPWFLVDKPISIEGVIAAPSDHVEGAARTDRESSIRIDIKVNSIPMPRGLDKLLSSLTEMGHLNNETSPGPRESGEQGAAGGDENE